MNTRIITTHPSSPFALTEPADGSGNPSALPGESTSRQSERPRVRGKFIFTGNDKLWVKGVTYGTFRPGDDGVDYPSPSVVESDFGAMAENGINAVRTYTVPPGWLLEAAQRCGLRVMVGIPWEQHIAFLDDATRSSDIEGRVRAAVRRCAQHPAILCYTVGNEIPATIARWHGRRRIERFIHSLYRAAKEEDPGALVTYVNFPTTEYLQLDFLDFCCFNVYLESKERLEAYLARLQNLAGERPLVMAEIGLDSRRNGERAQAESLDWQVRTAFAAGCAGTFVFSWTDEWYRGGYDIEDWDFGLTTRDRQHKPALSSVRQAYSEIPYPKNLEWPRVSVVVCSYNGARTIRDTLEGLSRLDYPGYEVIVVNDGSTDATPRIASEYAVRLISTENRGLSSARNTGWQEASSDIVAYIDDDAYPDPHWLQYLAYTFITTDYVGVGGPNIAPPGDGPLADCIANAPGGPVHVLISDREAEHIPGCNMAFRREALAAVGGFDPRYRAAGDDVDICWRLQERGWKIGFHPGAVDWHHRRNSVTMYWRQQKGYGKAEALLEGKWPRRYNAAGHLAWAGRLYGKGPTLAVQLRRQHVYGGVWGTAAYQSLYEPAPFTLLALTLMPEWYLVIAGLAGLSLLGLSWQPLLGAVPLFALAVTAPVVHAVISAARAVFPMPAPHRVHRVAQCALTAVLHLLQPLARLIGRLRHGLTPWRRRSPSAFVPPRRGTVSIWSEAWRAPEEWVMSVEQSLRRLPAIFRRGGDYDDWDLEVRGGMFGSARTRMAIEEHGAGRQLVRFRLWPRVSRGCLAFTLFFAALSLLATADHAWVAALLLGVITLAVTGRTVLECGWAVGSLHQALEEKGGSVQ